MPANLHPVASPAVPASPAEPLRFLTVDEAASRLGWSKRKCYHLIQRGELPSFKQDGHRRILSTALEAYMIAVAAGGR